MEHGDGLSALEVAAFSRTRASGFLKTALTYGIVSSKTLGIIEGETSPVRVEESSSTFWFCLEEVDGSFETPGISGVRDQLDASHIFLVSANTNNRKRQREFTLGKVSIWTASTTRDGMPPKGIRLADYEVVAPGVFRVTPTAELPPGEYAFYQPAIEEAVRAVDRVFAFGIPEPWDL